MSGRLDDAYANAPHIPGGEGYPARWAADAAAFRDRHPPEVLSYGPTERQALDLFRPGGVPEGVVVLVHGGFWLRFGRRDWSHLAAGPLGAGWAVAVVGYDLCPAVRIGQITAQVAQAVAVAAAAVPGAVRLIGHSAGGHLVARMPSVLPGAVLDRVARIVPLSPVAELAPLLETSMNAALRIDAAEAAAESPARHAAPTVPVHVWVGAAERPVFVQQARDLAKAWACSLTEEPGRHHFDVIEGLEAAERPLCRALLG